MLTLRELQKVIGNNTVVDIPALSMREGEIAALAGPAGSGKEVILELLTGRTRLTLGFLRIIWVIPAKDIGTAAAALLVVALAIYVVILGLLRRADR